MEVKEISTYIADLKQIFETGNFFGKTALDSKDLLSLIVFNQINIYPNKCSFKVWLPLLKLEPSWGSILSTFYSRIFRMKVLCTYFFYLHVTREKLQKKDFCTKKGSCKMLMKLTIAFACGKDMDFQCQLGQTRFSYDD